MQLFWKRKAKPAKQPVVATTNHDMENNRVVRWTQTWLIDFSDAILVRICQFCLMLGFIAGTIAVLSTKFNINAQPWFNIVWAVVQAVAIDGLFFAVWTIWKNSNGKGWLRTWYFFIGLLLGCVAALVNDIVSYSELQRVPTIGLAMQQLGIQEGDFSLSRSVLVVLVSILIVTLPRREPAVPVVQPVAEQPAIDTEKILQSVQEMHTNAMQEMIDKFKVVTIELVKETVERQIATIALPQIEAPDETCMEVDESEIQGSMPETVEPSIITVDGPIQGSMPTGRYTSPYALQIAQLYSENAEITIPEIMEVTGCARVTAEKWLGRMKPVDEG
jgi:hypothetical protein